MIRPAPRKPKHTKENHRHLAIIVCNICGNKKAYNYSAIQYMTTKFISRHFALSTDAAYNSQDTPCKLPSFAHVEDFTLYNVGSERILKNALTHVLGSFKF